MDLRRASMRSASDRMDELSLHPTVKPVALVADAMRDCSRRGEIVLDPFMGSGTTILAAERIGRRAYGLEIDPLYVDVAVRRWQSLTKRDAVLETTGQTFDELGRRNRPENPEGTMSTDGAAAHDQPAAQEAASKQLRCEAKISIARPRAIGRRSRG